MYLKVSNSESEIYSQDRGYYNLKYRQVVSKIDKNKPMTHINPTHIRIHAYTRINWTTER